MTSLRDRCALRIALKVKGKKPASWSCSLEAMSQFLNVGHPQRPLRGRACQRSVATVSLRSPSLWDRVLPGSPRSPGGQISHLTEDTLSDFLQDTQRRAGAGHTRAALCACSAPSSCLWPEHGETAPCLPGAARPPSASLAPRVQGQSPRQEGFTQSPVVSL